MADLENLGEEMVAAAGNAARNLIPQLLGFRTMLALVDVLAALTCAWCEPLLYRDAGERKMRAWPLYVVLGSLAWGVFGAALAIYSAIYSLDLFGYKPGAFYLPVYPLLILWGYGLGIADWLSAMARRKTEATEGYAFSRFLGWPRFLRAGRDASYWQQGAILFSLGFAMCWFDSWGGAMVMVSALAILIRLWVIRARIREDAMDRLDGEWLAGLVARKAATMGGADPDLGTTTATADVVSTADFLRRWSV